MNAESAFHVILAAIPPGWAAFSRVSDFNGRHFLSCVPPARIAGESMSPGLELMISVYQCSSRQPVAAFAELWPKIRLETTEEIGRRAACATFGTGVALVALGVVLLDSECVAVEVVCPFFEPSVPVIDPSVLARAALERVLVTVDAM